MPPGPQAQPVGPDERALLPRHCRGDDGAFAELLAAYRAPVYAFLVRAGLDPAARDDLFQEVFLRVHAAAATYQPSRPLKPWLFTIVANTVRSHFRKLRTERAVLVGEPSPPAAEGAPDAERMAEARDTLAWLEARVIELPLPQREVVILSCVEGMAHADIAQALQIPVNTVKTYLHRARLVLARALTARSA